MKTVLKGCQILENFKLPKVPEDVSSSFKALCSVLEAVCQERLNKEYLSLAIKLATKIARKKPSLLVLGSEKIWAAGIIHSLGLVNFLFDKSQSSHMALPYMALKDLGEWFNLEESVVSEKGESIRQMIKIHQIDPKWSLPSRAINNPLVWRYRC